MKRSCKPSSRSPGKPAEKVDRDESRHEGNNSNLRKVLLKFEPKKREKVNFSIMPRAFQPFISLVCVYEVQAGYPGAVQSELIL